MPLNICFADFPLEVVVEHGMKLPWDASHQDSGQWYVLVNTDTHKEIGRTDDPLAIAELARGQMLLMLTRATGV